MLGEEPAVYQLVGKVMAYQGYDGYLVWEDDQAQWNWDKVHTPTGGSSEESSTMDESLMERHRVKDEGLTVVNFFSEGA